MYNDGPPNLDLQKDDFIMSFTPDHYLAWSTFFGGNCNWTPGSQGGEEFKSLDWKPGVLYGSGILSIQPTSYWPLHDQ